jgi:hypothetical protein
VAGDADRGGFVSKHDLPDDARNYVSLAHIKFCEDREAAVAWLRQDGRGKPEMAEVAARHLESQPKEEWWS